MTFAEKIKSLRKERGLTQIQLAQAANMSLGVIADVESGRRTPSKQVAKSLAEFFHVPVQTFILEDAPLEKPTIKEVDFDKILQIVDSVQKFLEVHGWKITPEMRKQCIEYFYNMSVTDPDKIEEMLSFGQQKEIWESKALAH